MVLAMYYCIKRLLICCGCDVLLILMEKIVQNLHVVWVGVLSNYVKSDKQGRQNMRLQEFIFVNLLTVLWGLIIWIMITIDIKVLLWMYSIKIVTWTSAVIWKPYKMHTSLVPFFVNLPAPLLESGCHTQSRCGEGEGPTPHSEANHYN